MRMRKVSNVYISINQQYSKMNKEKEKNKQCSNQPGKTLNKIRKISMYMSIITLLVHHGKDIHRLKVKE
jgi:hypothetical protein